MYNKAASNGLQTFGVARCQLRLGQIALKRREVPSAISHFGEARGIFQAFKFDPGTAEALEGLAFADWLRYKLPEARKHAEWSLKLREAQPDQLVISRSLMLLGDLDNTEFHVQEAEARYTRALEIRRGLATERPLAECLDSLSKLYAGRGELDRAELMLKESLKLKTDVDDEIGCAVTQFSLAKIACRRNQIPDGIQSMEKVLAAAREEGNKELSGSVLLFLGFVNRQLGKTELARNHLEEGTKIFLEELGHLKLLKLMAVAGLTILASIDVKENRLTKAEKWIHLAQDLADNTRSKPALQAVYAVRLELCSAQGNHREVEKMEKKIEQLKQETGNVLIEFSLRSFLRTFGWF
ncbi:TPR-like protein [Dacryopinax primogenitus]|uniref:TPR-like protein n=1 Tax=Dacryopinax primogenitus (strain DJM 731) TaxID=1858805 RepID=M5FXV1_DACPD|nr:TPR-like protein [Dacryopinax primogenitus]EJT98366.1 TPR-like protein [Dacryopinax primogenitus]